MGLARDTELTSQDYQNVITLLKTASIQIKDVQVVTALMRKLERLSMSAQQREVEAAKVLQDTQAAEDAASPMTTVVEVMTQK